MEFKETLSRRRMVRNYTDSPVSAAVLQRIAAAALRAPSAGYSQGVAVVLVEDDATRTAIADLADEAGYVEKGFDPWISRAPAHLIIAVSEKVYRDRYDEPDKLDSAGHAIDWPVPYWWVDAGASMMASLLAAVDEGLAAGFLGVHDVPGLASLLGLPDDFEPIGVITLGHPAPDRKSGSLSRGKKPSMIHHNQWRNST